MLNIDHYVEFRFNLNLFYLIIHIVYLTIELYLTIILFLKYLLIIVFFINLNDQ